MSDNKAVIAASLVALAVGANLQRFVFAQVHMGVEVRITLFCSSNWMAKRAANAAFHRFAELDAIMSDYRPNSELSILNNTAHRGPVRVSATLFRVVTEAVRVSQRTDGTFDVTVGPLVQLWRTARQTRSLPDASQVSEARAKIGFRHIKLDNKSQTIQFGLQGMKIDLGGIGKGFACDEALAAITQRGVCSAMIEAGGDLACSGPPPGSDGWQIRVDGVSKPFTLRNQALSTSGSTEQYIEIGSVRYSHIMDPATGFGLTHLRQCTVIARRGIQTDPLATVGCIDSSQLKKFRNLAHYVVER